MKRREYFKLILIFLIFIMSINQTLYASYRNSTLDYITKSWKFYFFIGFLIFMIFLEIINNYLDKRLKPPKFTDSSKINNKYGLNDDEKDYDTTSQNIVETIRFNDIKFNEIDFLSFAKDSFIKLQNAWTNRDWKTIRLLENDELFNNHRKLLQEYIIKHQINMVDEINISSIKIIDYQVRDDFEFIDVNIVTTLKDYIIDEYTKNVIKGYKDTNLVMKYILTFARKNGVKSSYNNKSNIFDITNCPCCGAPISITESGKCEYCSNTITNGEYGFVIVNITGNRVY